MHRSVLASIVLCAAVLTACGSDDEPKQTASPSTSTSTPTASSTPTEPALTKLTKDELRAALLTIDSLPAGYSADPEDEGDSVAKYCGSAPEKAPTRIGQDFTKGGGMSTEFASVALAQYDSAADATKNFERLREGLKTCKGETVEGNEVRYSLMSTPDLGVPTLGVRIEAEAFTVLVNAAQVGATVVTSGSGGLSDVDADLAGDLLTEQVEAYRSAAGE